MDGRLQSAPATNFATVHNLTGTNITTLNANGTWGSVEVRADQVTNANAGDRYVRLQLTVASGPCNIAAIVLGGEAEQSPAKQYDLNSSYVNGRTVCNI